MGFWEDGTKSTKVLETSKFKISDYSLPASVISSDQFQKMHEASIEL